MKKLAFLLTLVGLTTAHAQHNIDFDDGWTFCHQGTTHHVRLPRAWNEDDAFRVNNADLPTDTVRYVKRFRLPRAARVHEEHLQPRRSSAPRRPRHDADAPEAFRGENGLDVFCHRGSSSLLERVLGDERAERAEIDRKSGV